MDFAGTCWQNCPDWATDWGGTCWDHLSIYGKGCCCTVFGCCGCGDGYHDDGCTCRRDRTFTKSSYIQGGQTQQKDCPGGRYKATSGGLLCYKECRDGYHHGSAVPTVCYSNCPSYAPHEGIATDTYCTENGNGVITATSAWPCPHR